MKKLFKVLFAFSLIAVTHGSHAAQEKKASKDVKLAIKLSTHGHDISFDQESFQVDKGSHVVVTYENQAEKNSEIIHNIAIVAPGKKDFVFKKLQEAEYDLEKIKGMKEIIVISKSLMPGEKDNIRFHAAQKGVYHYVCLMPGHGDVLGMVGKIYVK